MPSRKESSRRSVQCGLSLLELAVTLVIVGLLLASVQSALAMVDQARAKRLVAEARTALAVLGAYRDRYGALPGDDPQAGQRWTQAQASSGNGDGVLGEATDAATGALSEAALLWWHLRLAQLVDGPARGLAALTPPLQAGGGALAVQTDVLGLPGMALCFAQLAARYAEAMDAELDDGRGDTGSVRAADAAATPGALISAGAYRDDGDRRYTLCVAMQAGRSRDASPLTASATPSPTTTMSAGSAATPADVPVSAPGPTSATPAEGTSSTAVEVSTSPASSASAGNKGLAIGLKGDAPPGLAKGHYK
jgi:prepilin-type N-terminal cleavage/methylation domain-containing protein